MRWHWLVVAFMVATACEKPVAPASRSYQPPIIESFTVDPDLLRPTQKAELSVKAYSPEGSSLSYQWHSTGGQYGGKFSNPAVPSPYWLAPDTVPLEIYPIYISVTVKDQSNRSAFRQAKVIVASPKELSPR